MRGFLMLCCGVLVVSGVALLMKMVSTSEHFQVDSIQVEGNQRLSDQEVIDLSDIRHGVRTFDLDLEIIGQNIAKNDWIRRAEVERKLPRGIIIRVTERDAVFVINLDYMFYVDAGGEIFKVLRAGDSLDYPLVSGLERQQLIDQPQSSREQLKQVAELLLHLRQRKIFDEQCVSQLHIDSKEGLILYTRNYGVPIQIGRDSFEKKIDRLEKIYPELEARLPNLKYINLNVPDKVIVKK
ncbi:MAG: FtsQ-type POTRA domain-containing protein [Desulfuromonas sp.]|nr:FtsQ-type POTRA domain-containing protein [Desulfuromonas sp.]